MSSDIEKLHAYHSISPYLKREDNADLLRKLGMDSNNLDFRLKGLSIENEFALILYYSESCKHILAFDEGISFLSKSFSPDLMVELNIGRKIFIEIKSVSEDTKFKISGGNLDKRIEFAKDFGLELYFAVKIKGSWGLFSSSYLKINAGKIEYPKDLNFSEMNSLLELKDFIFTPGLKIVSKYSKSKVQPISEIGHQDFGGLIHYEMHQNGKPLLLADESQNTDVVKSVWMEYLHDLMSIQSQNVHQVDDDITIVEESLVHNSLAPEYSFFLTPIKHTLNQFGILHDSSSFLKQILQDRTTTPLKGLVRSTIEELKEKGAGVVFPDSVRFEDDGSFSAEHTEEK